MRSPELMNHLQAVGGYLRFNSALPQKLVNMIALLTSRHYTQQYEWDGNYPLSLKSGLSADIANAIGEGRRPENIAGDEELVYNFVTELLQNKSVSDLTYARLVGKFGEQGVVDATATGGLLFDAGNGHERRPLTGTTGQQGSEAGALPALETRHLRLGRECDQYIAGQRAARRVAGNRIHHSIGDHRPRYIDSPAVARDAVDGFELARGVKIPDDFAVSVA